MRKLYGIIDDGEILSVRKEYNIGSVELVPNCTWHQDDYTDDQGGHWIAADRLAELFGELCESTGMTQKALAEFCGVTPKTFSNYATGKSPVPLSVWKLVETRKIK